MAVGISGEAYANVGINKFIANFNLTPGAGQKYSITQTGTNYTPIAITNVTGSPTTVTVSPFNVVTQINVACTFTLEYSVPSLVTTAAFVTDVLTILNVHISFINTNSTTTMLAGTASTMNMVRGTSFRLTVPVHTALCRVTKNSVDYWATANVINVDGYTFTKISGTNNRIRITATGTAISGTDTFTQIAVIN